MKVIYAGSFDPVTYGHMDIIYRSRDIFGEVIVAALENKSKKSLFTLDERLSLLNKTFEHDKGIEIDSFQGLLIDYAKSKDIKVIVRGLRSATDYEAEWVLAMANRSAEDYVETLFIPSSHHLVYVSSSLAKEIAAFGGDVSDYVPPVVQEALMNKMRKEH